MENKMITVQETTKWDTPNHIYILNDDKSKMFGYIPVGNTEPVMFQKPMKFDKRHRTFKEIKG